MVPSPLTWIATPIRAVLLAVIGSWRRHLLSPGRVAALLVGAGIILVSAGASAAPIPLGRAASDTPELAMSFEDAAVLAAGLTPQGEAVLFSIAREPQTYFTRVVRRDELLLADAAGEARYQPFEDGHLLPARAVWVLVDLETGRLAHGTTPGFEAPVQPLPADGVRRGSGGRWNRLAAGLDEAQVLLVRPRSRSGPDPEAADPPGAWGGYWMDGSGRDVDGVGDGGFEAALEDMVPVTVGQAAPPPEELAPDDLLVVVDPSTLGYFVVRLTPGALNRSGS